MPLASRALVAAFTCLLLAPSASAAITDPEMTCAAYLRNSGHRTTASHAARDRTPADVAARIRAFCAANPKMKAMDAEMTMTGD